MDVFEFTVPTGTVEDEGPQGGGDDPIPEGGVYRMGPRVSGPILAYKVEPSYTEDARQARVSGMVLVSLAVDSSGKPLNVNGNQRDWGMDWMRRPSKRLASGVTVPV